MTDPLPEAFRTLLILAIAPSSLTLTISLFFQILVVLLLLACSAAMSATETAFFSLTPTQLNAIKSVKSASNHRILHLLEKPKLLLATVLISNTLVNVGIVIISTFIVNTHFDFSSEPVLGFIFQVVFITALLLLLGEIMPKVFANRNQLKVVSFMAGPISIAIRILYPFSKLLVSSTRFVEKRKVIHQSATLDDISNAIDITADGRVDEEDRKIMKSITRFGEINAREIMSPRVDLSAVDRSLPYHKVLALIIDSGYSRIPVYDETPDVITGILYIKDLLPYLSEPDTFDWLKLARPPFFVPENKPINDLLQEFQDKKIHMAIVVDEYGGTSGIITLEDIIEEIVGEINDEFDTESEAVSFSRTDTRTFVFEGKTSINDMCRVLGIDDRIFDEAKGESESLAGLMLELSGKMPVTGYSFRFENYLFQIEAADRRRVKKVKIILPDSEDQD